MSEVLNTQKREWSLGVCVSEKWDNEESELMKYRSCGKIGFDEAKR